MFVYTEKTDFLSEICDHLLGAQSACVTPLYSAKDSPRGSAFHVILPCSAHQDLSDHCCILRSHKGAAQWGCTNVRTWWAVVILLMLSFLFIYYYILSMRHPTLIFWQPFQLRIKGIINEENLRISVAASDSSHFQEVDEGSAKSDDYSSSEMLLPGVYPLHRCCLVTWWWGRKREGKTLH